MAQVVPVCIQHHAAVHFIFLIGQRERGQIAAIGQFPGGRQQRAGRSKMIRPLPKSHLHRIGPLGRAPDGAQHGALQLGLPDNALRL